MDKKNFMYFGGFLLLYVIAVFAIFSNHPQEESITTSKFNATVMKVENNQITVQDEDSIIYTFLSSNASVKPGEEVVIEYSGLLNKSTEVQKGTIIEIEPVSLDENLNSKLNEKNNMFYDYQKLAENKLKTMTLEEKIAQLLLVQYPGQNQEELLKRYPFAGYIFFEKDFQGKTEDEIQTMMRNLQKAAKIPILTAVDEEGGEVVRLSSNPNLRSEKFKSPSELYQEGGLNQIKTDTIEKSSFLNNLGINVNLGPVVDVSTTPSDYIYKRSLEQDTDKTSSYAQTVIQASKSNKVSYVLKHFPGYSDNADTHNAKATDNKSYEEIKKEDLPPFQAGINQGAEAVLVGHVTATNIDASNPASLSASVHNVLRNDLNFKGVIITDDLSMKAVSSTDNLYEKALLAGNDILMVTDYENAIRQIKSSVEDGSISENIIDNANLRILSWKYAKGLMFENQK